MRIEDVEIRYERKRGCGYRRPGGLYLVATGPAAECGKLPLPLKVCPVCGGGIKPSRGWTWVNPAALARDISCAMTDIRRADGIADCASCPLGGKVERAGLLWIGGSHYPKPEDWTREAQKMGVSRRMPAIPRDFVIGETWVLVAHREVIPGPCPECGWQGSRPLMVPPEGKIWDPRGGRMVPCPVCKGTGQARSPAIFHAFRPTAIEYVVGGHEDPSYLDQLRDRGITPVRIVRADEEASILTEAE